MKVKAIAEILSGIIEGNPDYEINTIAKIENAIKMRYLLFQTRYMKNIIILLKQELLLYQEILR